MFRMRSFRGKVGVSFLVLVSLTPAFFWFLTQPFDVRFGDTYSVLTSIGNLAAVVGTTLFALALILSARLKFLEDYFGGLDRMYNVHHVTGTVGFLLILVHPLFLGFRYLESSILDVGLFFLPDSNMPKNLGIIAVLMFMILLAITFFSRASYQTKRVLHQLLGVAFMFGTLHAVLIPNEISRAQSALALSLFSLSVLGIMAYLYRTVFGAFTVSKYTYRVTDIRLLDPSVTEIVLSPEGNAMTYTPGQFLFVSFSDPAVSKEVHPFSISSAPHEPELKITMKALGDYTTNIRNMRVGARAKIEGPFGHFSYAHARHNSQVWVAGGIGITPFLNMMRSLTVLPHSPYIIDFYYAVKSRAELIFLPELTAIASKVPGLRIIPHISDEQGFLTADVIHRESKTLADKDIFVCGPPLMMHSIIGGLGERGVPASLVHAEEFKLL
jgi:predicted ferric reductase